MGDTRAEGERNFWNGKESVTATNKSMFNTKPLNAEEMEDLRGEGGSDVFTSNRHRILNNEPEFKMKFWSNDDAPVIRPLHRPVEVYSAQPTRALDGYGGQACEKVTALKLRNNLQWMKHACALAAGGALVFSGICYCKGVDPRGVILNTQIPTQRRDSV
eukprot:TRINITY_DN6150_c0_g1_i3.p1 TRINITY_DN6150_c0_g1~~TRINITY_DN6150_c0_g1_i3.p1  ORF type:complete len:160 (+),score=34.14 TRINITY_DN6150_c0_g1_i3:185-664(+)